MSPSVVAFVAVLVCVASVQATSEYRFRYTLVIDNLYANASDPNAEVYSAMVGDPVVNTIEGCGLQSGLCSWCATHVKHTHQP
jgi:hypothetical protein